jgi:hypothetical protein
MASQMVNFPASIVLPAGLTFTWTTGVDGPAEVVETVQAPPAPTESTSTTTDSIFGPVSGSLPLTTRRPLPRYQGRRLDNTDLIESINRVTTGLVETLTLVDSIRDRSAEDHHSRPARASRQRCLDTDLVITTTLEGWTVRYRPVPATSLRLGGLQSPNGAFIQHLSIRASERDI